MKNEANCGMENTVTLFDWSDTIHQFIEEFVTIQHEKELEREKDCLLSQEYNASYQEQIKINDSILLTEAFCKWLLNKL